MWTQNQSPMPLASLPANILASSHFLGEFLDEASTSGDMQQTCRKASCGRCPQDELDPYLAKPAARGSGGPGVQLCSCKHSCTGWTALGPSSCVVKPARKQGLIYPGLFDNLKSLQAVHLQGNPWECNCDILYLRSWLQWQQNRTFYRDVKCASPAHLQDRIIAYLTEDEIISTCQYWYCSLALLSQLCLFILLLLQAILIIFITMYLQRFRRMTADARSAIPDVNQHVDAWASPRSPYNSD
uniref:Glycoprotein Ib platelet subunit beta n=1 Tax=Dromaius novaehollandiae TaxID=8790 RepID=A0A8C4J1E1_DRONO